MRKDNIKMGLRNTGQGCGVD